MCRGRQRKRKQLRRANARATGGGPPPVSNLRPWESAVSIQRSIISNVHTVSANIKFISTMFRNW